MQEQLLARALKETLLNPSSAVINALVSEISETYHLGFPREAIISWLRRVLSPSSSFQPTSFSHEIADSPSSNTYSVIKPEIAITPTSCWLFPAAPLKDDETAIPGLQLWLGRKMWGMGKSTAGRKRLRRGDFACFYAKGIGIVATARISDNADSIVPETEWPEKTPYEPSVFKVPLADIVWLDHPVDVRQNIFQLDAFKEKDISKRWSWFVQSTRRLTEHDYRLLIGRQMA